jgi:hypothetical protein
MKVNGNIERWWCRRDALSWRHCLGFALAFVRTNTNELIDTSKQQRNIFALMQVLSSSQSQQFNESLFALSLTVLVQVFQRGPTETAWNHGK